MSWEADVGVSKEYVEPDGSTTTARSRCVFPRLSGSDSANNGRNALPRGRLDRGDG